MQPAAAEGASPQRVRDFRLRVSGLRAFRVWGFRVYGFQEEPLQARCKEGVRSRVSQPGLRGADTIGQCQV